MRTGLTILLVVGVCDSCLLVADRLALRDARSKYREPQTMTRLVFKGDVIPLLSKQLLATNQGGGLRLLVQTRDSVVVFVKCDKQDSQTKGSFIIPMAELISIHNEPVIPHKGNTGSCP